MNARVQSCCYWQWRGFFLFSFGTFAVSSTGKKSHLNIWRQECHLEAHVLLFGSLNFVLREENCWCVILWAAKTAWVMSSGWWSPSPRGLWLPVPAHMGQACPLLWHLAFMPAATDFARSPITAPEATHVYVAYTVLRASFRHVSIQHTGTPPAIL